MYPCSYLNTFFSISAFWMSSWPRDKYYNNSIKENYQKSKVFHYSNLKTSLFILKEFRYYSYTKSEQLEEDEGLHPRILIDENFCKQGPFSSLYFVYISSVFIAVVKVLYILYVRLVTGQMINFVINQSKANISDIRIHK